MMVARREAARRRAAAPLPRSRATARPLSMVWAQDFLYAGTSALFLLIAARYPDLWFLPLLALTPFLYGVLRTPAINSEARDSVRLGFLLGVTYFAVSLSGFLFISPGSALLKLAGGTVLFTLFGWLAGQSRLRLGFNPIIVAALWILFELALIKLGLIHGLLSAPALVQAEDGTAGAALFYKTAVVFGFLAVSFVIVLFNSLFVLAIDALVSIATARGTAVPKSEENRDLFLAPGLRAQRFCLVVQERAPPAPRPWISATWAV